ncbi:carbonic anhydrase 2-like [Leptopilina heterotoma]|uniref:carbonic anhydrase 2-like n=1 Tax=Leptopilina heterotoma TaxID=63436 RepID=UPI001CAA0A70|nr:carbonic anhydrase 2-like [Leptopilina heterotoma]
MYQFFISVILTYAFLYKIVSIKLECTAEMKTDDIKSSIRYNYLNAHEWGNNYSQCSGNRQSPINIDLSNISSNDQDFNLIFHGYDVIPKEMKFSNTGQKAELIAKWTNETPFIQIANRKYIFDSLHFHWGINDSCGSEHTYNYTCFPLEMHLVHYRDKYESFKKALNQSDGLLVYGTVFQINDGKNSSISPLAKSLLLIKKENSSTTVEPFPLSIFTTERGYYMYNGSVTRPLCWENVLWILSAQILTITKKEMQLFRLVEFSNGEKLNHRPIQPLNKRKIIYIP